jgi:Zn-dependent protease
VNSGIQVGRILGIPVVVNLSWFLILVFVIAMLALRFYPSFIPEESPYRNDKALHWIMASVSGLVFFGSILLHELAHSVVALRQGIPVKNITLFVFGGVSQIGGEARRPLNEFVMAIIGPLTSLVLGLLFLGAWWLTGFSTGEPVAIVVQWLFVMNIALAAFNMAPGFPMDGGRVLRSIVWAISGNAFRATRIATLAGRSLGYTMMFLGALAFFGVFRDYFHPINGVLFAFLGLYLENAARQSWFQAKALDILCRHPAEDIMRTDLETAFEDERLHYLANRGGNRYMFFVTDDDERVTGVLTHNEVLAVAERERGMTFARQVMLATDQVPVALPREDAASILQRLESDGRWHMPVVSEGRVIGVVAKDDLLRLLASNLFPQSARRPDIWPGA